MISVVLNAWKSVKIIFIQGLVICRNEILFPLNALSFNMNEAPVCLKILMPRREQTRRIFFEFSLWSYIKKKTCGYIILAFERFY